MRGFFSEVPARRWGTQGQPGHWCSAEGLVLGVGHRSQGGVHLGTGRHPHLPTAAWGVVGSTWEQRVLRLVLAVSGKCLALWVGDQEDRGWDWLTVSHTSPARSPLEAWRLTESPGPGWESLGVGEGLRSDPHPTRPPCGLHQPPLPSGSLSCSWWELGGASPSSHGCSGGWRGYLAPAAHTAGIWVKARYGGHAPSSTGPWARGSCWSHRLWQVTPLSLWCS